MVALERIKEFSDLPKEGPEFVEPRPPASWPHEGAISVENLVMRYAVRVVSLFALEKSNILSTARLAQCSPWTYVFCQTAFQDW